MRRILLLLATIALQAAANAAPSLSLSDHSGEVPVGGYADFFQEPGPRLSLEQARAEFAAGRGRPTGNAIPGFGLGARPVWMRLSVLNQGDASAPRRLTVENSWLDDIEVHLVHDGRVAGAWALGDSKRYGERPVPGRFFAVDHAFDPGVTEAYLRFESPDPLVLPIFLLAPPEAALQDRVQSMSYGFLYGYLIALIAFNTIIYLGIRDRRYLFYGVFLAAFIVLNVAYTGHGFAAIWPQSVALQRWIIPVLMVLYPVAGFAFARAFLDAPRTLPRTTRILEAATVGAIACLAVAMAAGGTQVAALWVAFVYVTFFSFAMLGLGIYAFRAAVPSSGYFLLASIASMVGTAATSLSVWGWIGFSAGRYRAVEFGTLIDATLLALALGGQFRLIELARAAADTARDELARTNERLNATLREAEHLAATDRLTGLWNRLHLEAVAASEMERAARYRHALSVLAIDLDDFKQVNDSLGHHVGDEVLVEVARLTRQRVRDSDVVTRWGGEEFLVLMPNTTLREAGMAAEALRRVFESHPFGHGARLTISVGVAQWRAGHEGLEAWFARADRALYRAKEAGRNRFALDDPPAPPPEAGLVQSSNSGGTV